MSYFLNAVSAPLGLPLGFPEAAIEIHADVGTTKRSATSKFVEFVRGWIRGSGFTAKVKPYSWASSTVADWHTK